MPNKICLDKIKKKGSILCDDLQPNYCKEILQELQQYNLCDNPQHDTIVPFLLNSQQCYCCCISTEKYIETKVEVRPGIFKYIQDIEVGEKVLTTGKAVKQWKEKVVTVLGGLKPGVQDSLLFKLEFEFDDNDLKTTELVCLPDHLFLMPNGKLRPVQKLLPGAEVQAANGKKARLLSIALTPNDNGVYMIGMGNWEKGNPLKGHLINTNNIIVADLSVQINYFTNNIDKQFLDLD